MILTLRAGQAGRLIVTRAEGTPASAAPIGAVEVQHVGPVAMETDAETGDLLAPPMPPGMHLFEIRLAGRTIATGHFEVLPSPLDGVLGEQSWEVQAAEAPELAVINISWPQVGTGVSAIVDADYDPTSANAQAGTAVAQAVAGLVTAEDVEKQIASTPKEVTLSTPAGTSNATCNYVELDPARVPTGELTEISYRTGSTTATGMTTEPMWLAVWELAEGSSSDYELVGVSSNTVSQRINATLAWTFERLPLHGRRLRLIPTLDPTQTVDATCQLRIRTSTSTDSTKCVYNNSQHDFTPRLDLLALCPQTRFASASHESDAGCHVTEAEKNILSAFSWNTTYGLSFVHKTDGMVDNLLRVMLSVTGTTIMTAGTVAVQAAQITRNTRTAYSTYTDTATGTTYNFGGHTLSDIDMAPYGITTPCVWAGDATLPLLLRGSELRINGTAINVDALVSLLSQSEALLALVGGQAS